MTTPKNTSLSDRARARIAAALGVLFLALILHDLYSYHALTLVKARSIHHLLSRVRSYVPLGALGIAIFVLAAGLALGIAFKKRKGIKRPSRGPHKIILYVPILLVLFAAALLWRRYRPEVPPVEWSAAASLLVLISLLFFTIFSKRKTLLLAHILLVAVTTVGLMAPRFFRSHENKVKLLEKRIDREEQSLIMKRDAFGKVVPDLLTKARTSAGETSYLFYKHLDDILSAKTPLDNSRAGILLDIPMSDNLTTLEGSPLVPAGTKKGVLAFPKFKGGTVLRNQKELDLEIESIGSITIRMKVSAGRYFRLYWNSEERLDADIGIQIPLGSPGEFHSYEVSESIVSISTLRRIKSIKHIFLMPSDRDADVEIESIRILNNLATRCKEKPFETGHENIGGEIRTVLFVRSPSEIAYSVTVPAESPVLLFGSAAADPRVPVLFQIALREKDREKLLFSEQRSQVREWKDYKLDLSPWAGRSVEILFRTASEEPNVGIWSNPTMLGTPPPRPNVVIYLIDALRADHLGAYGYKRNTSPRIDQFALQGTLFERAYSNGCKTKHSVPSLFSSNPITALGMWSNLSLLPESYPTLSEILQNEGYKTAAFHSGPNVGPFSGTHRGFCQLFEQQYFWNQGHARRESPKRTGEVLIGDSLFQWLDESFDRNFFLYIHTTDVHGPYNPPKEYFNFFSETGRPVRKSSIYDPPWLVNPTSDARTGLYDGEILYSDVQFGRFLDKLEGLGILGNTIIIFTSDHGEYFGEHGLWGHFPPPYVQGTHVPLLMVWPDGIPAGRRISSNVQLMDIMPTILDAAGEGSGFFIMQGRSLLPLARGSDDREFEERAVYVEGAYPGDASIHLGQFHFITEKNLIFDLSSDPAEKNYLNEFSLSFRLKSRLRSLAKMYRDAYSVLYRQMAGQKEQTYQIDAETLEQLKTLGYIR